MAGEKKVICDHRGGPKCDGCEHNVPHKRGNGWCDCALVRCWVRGFTMVHCVEVKRGK